MKTRRLSTIRQLVEREAVHSQEQLRHRLIGLGFDVTQATLSRDIKELGLVKRASDGAYSVNGVESAPAAAAFVALSRALAEYLLGIDVAQQLLVLRTGPGQAQPLALAIDRARLDDVLGTIAGDDTILLICRDGKCAQNARKVLDSLVER